MLIPELDVGGVPPEGSPRGAVATQYAATIELLAQVNPLTMDQQRQASTGADPTRDLELTFHYRHLEQLGMIGADGSSLLRHNDRLVGMRSRNGNTDINWREDQYLYAVRTQDDSFGMPGGDRNLLILVFTERRKGVENTS